MQPFCQPRLRVRVAGENFRVLGRERYVIVGECDPLLGREETIGRLIKRIIDGGARRGVCCHGLSSEANAPLASASHGKNHQN